MASENLIKAVVATAEVMGTELSTEGARVFCDDLSEFPESQVMKALTRCRREVRGRLTLADVIARIDDGHPGADEAWAMLPRTEAETVVWTEEMRQAFGVAVPLLGADDVAARMAFRQAYERLLVEARSSRKPVWWSVSLGHEKESREAVLTKAIHAGRISRERARALLPNARFEETEIHRSVIAHQGETTPIRVLIESMQSSEQAS